MKPIDKRTMYPPGKREYTWSRSAFVCKACGKAARSEYCFSCKEILGMIKKNEGTIKVQGPGGSVVLKRLAPKDEP